MINMSLSFLQTLMRQVSNGQFQNFVRWQDCYLFYELETSLAFQKNCDSEKAS